MKGAAEMTVFEAKGLGKTYGRGRKELTALEDVSFALEKGRVYGLVGNNGAGKTTLLRLMAGLGLPSAGELSLFGASDPKGLREARKKLGCLISEPCGYGDLSLWQNLRAQALMLPKERQPDLQALCRVAGLEESVLRRSLGKCSAGQKQRYGLASALLGEPELLLLDEPMNGLDPAGAAETRELLLHLNRERGLTMLVSSHLLGELHRIATDYVFLRFGRVLETVTASELDRRVEAQGLKDPEDYFLALSREAQRREGSFFGGDGP